MRRFAPAPPRPHFLEYNDRVPLSTEPSFMRRLQRK